VPSASGPVGVHVCVDPLVAASAPELCRTLPQPESEQSRNAIVPGSASASVYVAPSVGVVVV
jgi:hypothetical protein